MDISRQIAYIFKALILIRCVFVSKFMYIKQRLVIIQQKPIGNGISVNVKELVKAPSPTTYKV